MPVVFPYFDVAEGIPFFVDAAPGMFGWRQNSVQSLLLLPDVGGGDLTDEQRREALEQFAGLHRPLTALALFWSVVALEDLFRDMGTQLNGLPQLGNHFPAIADIAPTRLQNPQPYQRPDRDPPYLTFTRLNELYRGVFGIGAVDPGNIAQLSDLALIRHTVAHHGGLVRPIDLPRFQYYQMQPGRVINPPVSFVRNTARFVAGVGSAYLRDLRQRIFGVVLPAMGALDLANPPALIVGLIEAFHYFGKIAVDRPQLPQPPPTTLEEIQRRLEAATQVARADLLQQCLVQLPATN